MATIARPITKTMVSTTGWGIPVTDQLNANTNALAARLNLLGIYQVRTGPVNTGTALGLRDVITCTIPTFTTTVTVAAIAQGSCGGPASPYNWKWGIQPLASGAAYITNNAVYSTPSANMYIDAGGSVNVNVAANANPSLKLQIDVTSATAGQASWCHGSILAFVWGP